MSTNSGTPLPWQHEAWQKLRPLAVSDRLPHALLLSGLAGCGVGRFGEALARALLCSQPNPSPHAPACGRCPDCVQSAAGSHPDQLWVRAEAQNQGPIRVDQVREAGRFLTLSGQRGWRVVLVAEAERMNSNAANALLKSLEEPPPRRLLLLLSAAPLQLPATIRSRCQLLRFGRPSPRQSRGWLRQELEREGVNLGENELETLLALSRQAPLRALRLARGDALTRRRTLFDSYCRWLLGHASVDVKEWHQNASTETLGWLLSWLQDSLRLSLTGPGLSSQLLENPDLKKEISRLAGAYDRAFWLHMIKVAQRLLAILATASQVNIELQLDAFFRTHPACPDNTP